MRLSTLLRGYIASDPGSSLDFYSGPAPDPNVPPTGNLLASVRVEYPLSTYDGTPEWYYADALARATKIYTVSYATAAELAPILSKFSVGTIGYARLTNYYGAGPFGGIADPSSAILTVSTTPGSADVTVSSLSVTSPGIVLGVALTLYTPES